MRRDTVAAKLWAEFVGTAILILLGDGVVANTLFGSRLGSPEAAPFSGYNWNTITLGWGFAVVMAVYVAGGITGAHINPAVTAAAMARWNSGMPFNIARSPEWPFAAAHSADHSGSGTTRPTRCGRLSP